MTKAEFDAEGFFAALDAVRQARRLNWKQVAEQSGVSASTLTRLAQKRRPDVDSLAGLLSWSGLSGDEFVRVEGRQKSQPEPIGQIATYLRADPRLSTEAQSAMLDIIAAAYGRLSEK